jgi:hypothetical protein
MDVSIPTVFREIQFITLLENNTILMLLLFTLVEDIFWLTTTVPN